MSFIPIKSSVCGGKLPHSSWLPADVDHQHQHVHVFFPRYSEREKKRWTNSFEDCYEQKIFKLCDKMKWRTSEAARETIWTEVVKRFDLYLPDYLIPIWYVQTCLSFLIQVQVVSAPQPWRPEAPESLCGILQYLFKLSQTQEKTCCGKHPAWFQ